MGIISVVKPQIFLEFSPRKLAEMIQFDDLRIFFQLGGQLKPPTKGKVRGVSFFLNLHPLKRKDVP